MSEQKKDTVSWMQTTLRQHKELLEYVYNAPIQEIVRHVMAEKVANVDVKKQNAFFEKVNKQ